MEARLNADISRKLRRFLAERLDPTLAHKDAFLEPTDLDILLDVIAHEPDRFYGVLQTLSHYIDQGDLRNLLEMAQRSLRRD